VGEGVAEAAPASGFAVVGVAASRTLGALLLVEGATGCVRGSACADGDEVGDDGTRLSHPATRSAASEERAKAGRATLMRFSLRPILRRESAGEQRQGRGGKRNSLPAPASAAREARRRVTRSSRCRAPSSGSAGHHAAVDPQWRSRDPLEIRLRPSRRAMTRWRARSPRVRSPRARARSAACVERLKPPPGPTRSALVRPQNPFERATPRHQEARTTFLPSDRFVNDRDEAPLAPLRKRLEGLRPISLTVPAKFRRDHHQPACVWSSAACRMRSFSGAVNTRRRRGPGTDSRRAPLASGARPLSSVREVILGSEI